MLDPGQHLISHLQLIQDSSKPHMAEGTRAQDLEKKLTRQLRFIPAWQGVEWDPS